MQQVFSITADQKAIREIERLCASVGKKMPSILLRARKDTSRAVVTRTNKELRPHLSPMKAADIKPMIVVHHGPQSTTITPSNKRIPLKRFGAVQLDEGIIYRIGTKRRIVRGAFTVAKFDGHVFKRAGKRRLPIQKLHGPSLAAVLEDTGTIMPKLESFAATEFVKKIDQRLAYLYAVQRGEVR